MDARCRIELLGGLRLRRGDQVVTRFRTRKVGELLAYLSCYSLHPHPREALIDLLWPDCDPQAGRVRLNNAVSSLRRALTPPGASLPRILIADRETVGLDPDRVTSDVGEFEAALQAAARARRPADGALWLARAVELYAGHYLPGTDESWVLGGESGWRRVTVRPSAS
jgi:DNA-binding SARP family transcriptional activator